MIIKNKKILIFICILQLNAIISILWSSPALAQQNNAAYQASSVTSIDYSAITTLGEFKTLVYKNRWKGIAANDVLAQLANFKTASSSPAIRDIWRDVLLSDFNGLSFQDNTQQAKLMAERIRLLNRLGFFDEAVRLYQRAAAQKPVPEIIARQGIEAFALSGSADGACLEIYMAAKYLVGKDWLQDTALCAVYFGEKKLAAQLYQDAEKEAGSGFKSLYKALDSNTSIAVRSDTSSLWRTLSLAKGAKVTGGDLKKADPMSLAAFAVNSRVPLQARLSAASKAANEGTIGADRLRQLYEMKHESETGLSSIIDSAIAGGNLADADYYAAARFHFESNNRATIVKNAMHQAKPVTNIKSHVYGWVVDKLTLHVKSLGWFAPEGYSLMILTNRPSSAKMYYQAGNLDATPFMLVDVLIGNKPWPVEERKKWEDAMRKRYKDAAAKKIEDLIFLASAYDQEKILNLPPVKADPDVITIPTTLFTTISKGGKALTLITALNNFSLQKQWNSFDITSFANIIELMTREGLFGERKKITLEFLVQNML